MLKRFGIRILIIFEAREFHILRSQKVKSLSAQSKCMPLHMKPPVYLREKAYEIKFFFSDQVPQARFPMLAELKTRFNAHYHRFSPKTKEDREAHARRIYRKASSLRMALPKHRAKIHGDYHGIEQCAHISGTRKAGVFRCWEPGYRC